jgi:hypothetical protein
MTNSLLLLFPLSIALLLFVHAVSAPSVPLRFVLLSSPLRVLCVKNSPSCMPQAESVTMKLLS